MNPQQCVTNVDPWWSHLLYFVFVIITAAEPQRETDAIKARTDSHDD